MFGWRMEEEAKLEFTITVNWRREDGSVATTQLATLNRGACRSVEDVGLQLGDAKMGAKARLTAKAKATVVVRLIQSSPDADPKLVEEARKFERELKAQGV